MNRDALEHLIRAAAAVTNERELVVLGSQSILGTVPNAPAELLSSRVAEIYLLRNPDAASLIDGSIGEGSIFDERFGYYARGVVPDAAMLPARWEDRLVKIQNENTNRKIGYCLSPGDLAAAKLAAFRENDLKFVDALLRHGIVSPDELAVRLGDLHADDATKTRASSWLQRAVERLTLKGRKAAPFRP